MDKKNLIMPGYGPEYRCHKCLLELKIDEIFQLESIENQNKTLKHIIGFQSKATIFSLVISSFAIVISIVALIYKK